MGSSRVILVTGANRGIGLAIIQSLATHPATKTSTLLLGSRDVSKGQTALEELKKSESNIDITRIHVVELDVSSNDSIRAAVARVESEYGHLDVLVNNAGIGAIPSAEDYSDVRPSFADMFDVNVTSVYMMTTLFLPLLKASPGGNPKVINVSSARGSLGRSLLGQVPPSVAVGYTTSKTALNAQTLEMSRDADCQGVEFQLACPGSCKTAFNGFKGARDPIEGAIVVVELIVGDRRGFGYWETIGSDRTLKEVPW